jgi:hypothetical protein
MFLKIKILAFPGQSLNLKRYKKQIMIAISSFIEDQMCSHVIANHIVTPE